MEAQAVPISTVEPLSAIAEVLALILCHSCADKVLPGLELEWGFLVERLYRTSSDNGVSIMIRLLFLY